MRQNHLFDDWPLETLAADREAFFAFLQERWPVFLDHVAAEMHGTGEDVRETAQYRALGPPQLFPFDHHDIRGYIDNLFVEGLLHPVPHEQAESLSHTWVSIGIRTTSTEGRSRRLGKIIESLEATIPPEEAKHTDWFHFAHSWAELILLANEKAESIPKSTANRIKNLQAQMLVLRPGFSSGMLALLICRRYLRSWCIISRAFLPGKWERRAVPRWH